MAGKAVLQSPFNYILLNFIIYLIYLRSDFFTSFEILGSWYSCMMCDNELIGRLAFLSLVSP